MADRESIRNQIIAILITAVLTGLFSVTTIWIGSNLTRGNENRTWRRDHALEAYTEFLGAVQQVNFESNTSYAGPDCGTQSHADEFKIVLNKIVDLQRSCRRAILLTPNSVNEHMLRLTDHMLEVGQELNKCPKITESDNLTLTRKTGELLAAFENAARDDLGIHLP